MNHPINTPDNQLQPSLRFRPLRPAVAGDAPSRLDLLLTVTTSELPPEQQSRPRPPLNLALVIDRSGSMSGRKLSQARKAARFLAGELTARDRLAIVTFDGEVEVLVPSTPVTDRQRFINAINRIHSGGCTALFDGWLSGAGQVAEHLDPAALNRVLLLSDGQANEGLTDAELIAGKVAGLTARGISTSAFGLGDGFDEDLMGAIAGAGDGTLAFIESPDVLADLYASELQGLAATTGRRVSLGLRGVNGAELVDVLNDLRPTGNGTLMLPNLRAGQEQHVAVRLELPAWTPNREIVQVRLAWDAPAIETRQILRESLTLPVRSAADIGTLDTDPQVAEQFALQEANRERRRAIEALDAGDLLTADGSLDAAMALFSALPGSDLASRELQLLIEKKALLRRDRNRSRKTLRSESLRSSTRVWSEEDPS